MTLTPARILVLTLATARLTRFVTTDALPDHAVLHHLHDKAAEKGFERDRRGVSRPKNLVGYASEMINCPFCIGFWLGGAVLVGEVALGHTKLWKLGIGALALNYVVGHVSSRID